MSLKPNQIIDIKPYGSNIKYYKSLGYKFSQGDTIQVPAELLPKCKIKVKIICDVCGCEYEMEYKAYLNGLKSHNGKNYCINCFNNNPEVLKEREEKKMAGVQRIYGVNNVFQASEIKEKIQATRLNIYGVKNPMQNYEVQEKMAQTNLKKYGYRVALNNADIYAKAQESLYLHGTQKCSQQQYAIFELLKEYYDSEMTECVLNKPVSSCSADISLCFTDCNIDIEYDGSYWHQDKQKDRRRDEVFKSFGYKVLRIKGSKTIPTLYELTTAIENIRKGTHSYAEIILKDYNNN